MIPAILVQAGHSAAFPPYQQGGGGAPGEAAWTAALAQRLAARLSTRGIAVTIVGCWLLDNSNPPPAVAQEYALFVALHYDADIYPERTGCFAGRAAADPCAAEADRFLALWRDRYPAATGIALHEERLNPNVTDYYAFRVTSATTPGVLIEHGVGMGLDHAALYDGIDTVADADTAAILDFLGLVDEGGEDVATVKQLQAQIDALNGVNTQLQRERDYKDQLLQAANSQIGALTHDVIEPLRFQVATLQDQLATAQAAAATRTVEKVEVVFSDGSAVEVPAAAPEPPAAQG